MVLLMVMMRWKRGDEMLSPRTVPVSCLVLTCPIVSDSVALQSQRSNYNRNSRNNYPQTSDHRSRPGGPSRAWRAAIETFYLSLERYKDTHIIPALGAVSLRAADGESLCPAVSVGGAVCLTRSLISVPLCPLAVSPLATERSTARTVLAG